MDIQKLHICYYLFLKNITICKDFCRIHCALYISNIGIN